jgi:hypothetical protein
MCCQRFVGGFRLAGPARDQCLNDIGEGGELFVGKLLKWVCL